MVFLDPVGVPMKYDQLQIYKDFVGKTACRMEVVGTGRTIDSARMGDKWKHDLLKIVRHGRKALPFT